MSRWVAKLSLTVVEAEIVSGPQGPVPRSKQHMEFQTNAEESGTTPASALGVVIDQLHHWTNMLTETPAPKKEEN